MFTGDWQVTKQIINKNCSSIYHFPSRVPQNTITPYEPQNTSEETKLNSDLSENDIKSIEKDSQEEPNDETQTEDDTDGEINEETEKYSHNCCFSV